MTKLPKEISDWLGKFGIDQKALMRVRFGGVIGKQALVGVLGVAGIVYVASRAGTNGNLLAGCLLGVFVLTIVIVVAIGIHGHQHPVEATLEGGEIVVVQHLRQEFAAKGIGHITPSPPVLEGIGDRPMVKDAKESSN
jgi:hypothetical protein